MKKLYLCILLLTVSAPSLADSEGPATSGDLEDFCKGVKGRGQVEISLSSGVCMGVIGGAINTSISYQRYMESHYNFSPTLCLPSGWTTGQGVKVFLKWAKEHPERLHEPDFSGVIAAHLEAFPCVHQ